MESIVGVLINMDWKNIKFNTYRYSQKRRLSRWFLESKKLPPSWEKDHRIDFLEYQTFIQNGKWFITSVNNVRDVNGCVKNKGYYAKEYIQEIIPRFIGV